MIAYKYRSGRGTKDDNGMDIFERDIELLSHDTIYIPTIDQLNDPAEALYDDSLFNLQIRLFKPLASGGAMERVKDSVSNLYNKVCSSGIYSLSKEPANELMWAYYASGHCGYAIIFDTEVISRSFKEVKYDTVKEFDVAYSTKLPQFDITKIMGQSIVDMLKCFVGNKSKAWKHEAEHRLVFEKGGRRLKIDYRAIKGFVFGSRMAEEDIDFIMKTFSGRDLDYSKIVLKENSYELSLKKLKDRYPTDEKYCPNKVEYDIGKLLKNDKLIEGVGYKYRAFVEAALKEVSREAFVIDIDHIVVRDDQEYPNIVIWTKIDQEDTYRTFRKFEYEVVKGKLEAR
ncbi:MAG: DUF2971 domain-containing protein [Prevotella sp.]|nr:DUF2971 domain-containing protein [Prevotella sp.]